MRPPPTIATSAVSRSCRRASPAAIGTGLTGACPRSRPTSAPSIPAAPATTSCERRSAEPALAAAHAAAGDRLDPVHLGGPSCAPRRAVTSPMVTSSQRQSTLRRGARAICPTGQAKALGEPLWKRRRRATSRRSAGRVAVRPRAARDRRARRARRASRSPPRRPRRRSRHRRPRDRGPAPARPSDIDLRQPLPEVGIIGESLRRRVPRAGSRA